MFSSAAMRSGMRAPTLDGHACEGDDPASYSLTRIRPQPFRSPRFRPYLTAPRKGPASEWEASVSVQMESRHYLKVRDRQSYEFALTSAAVALHLQGGVIRTARVAAGGVGTVPWKLSAVEAYLVGKRPSPSLWTGAAERATEGARPLAYNGFKVELLKRTIERQLRIVGGTR